MKIETHACDNCKAQKKETNHWWKVYQCSLGGVLVTAWDSNPRRRKNPQTTPEVEFTAETHLCGASCVTEWLSKNLL